MEQYRSIVEVTEVRPPWSALERVETERESLILDGGI